MLPRLDRSSLALAALVALSGCECESSPASQPAPTAAPTPVATPAASAVPSASANMPPPRRDVPRKCRTLCQITGRCTLHPESGECLATSDEDCRTSRSCIVNGMCSARGGLCLGTSDEDCRKSTRCKDEGLCSLAEGPEMSPTNCIAKTDADCAESKTCKEDGRCKAIRLRCDDPDNPIKPNTIPEKPPPF